MRDTGEATPAAAAADADGVVQEAAGADAAARSAAVLPSSPGAPMNTQLCPPSHADLYRRFLAMARSHLNMGVPLFIDRDLDELVGTVRGLQARMQQLSRSVGG